MGNENARAMTGGETDPRVSAFLGRIRLSVPDLVHFDVPREATFLGSGMYGIVLGHNDIVYKLQLIGNADSLRAESLSMRAWLAEAYANNLIWRRAEQQDIQNPAIMTLGANVKPHPNMAGRQIGVIRYPRAKGNVEAVSRDHPERAGQLRALALSALENLHRLNVIHGDAKLDNALVLEDWSVVWSDFGKVVFYNDSPPEDELKWDNLRFLGGSQEEIDRGYEAHERRISNFLPQLPEEFYGQEFTVKVVPIAPEGPRKRRTCRAYTTSREGHSPQHLPPMHGHSPAVEHRAAGSRLFDETPQHLPPTHGHSPDLLEEQHRKRGLLEETSQRLPPHSPSRNGHTSPRFGSPRHGYDSPRPGAASLIMHPGDATPGSVSRETSSREIDALFPITSKRRLEF